jgi:ABC-type sugar transport system permease subunit
MVLVAEKETAQAPPRRTLSFARRETLLALAFLSPWLIGLVVFTALPIIASLALSFTNFNILHPDDIRYIGLDNYSRMWNEIVNNGAVGQSLGVTGRFALMSVPLGIGLALGLAMLLNQRLVAGKHFFRTLFFMPVLIPLVASTIVWQGFLNGSTGWLAQILRSFGLPAPNWFTDPAWALPGLVILGTWGIGNMMLIFLAGLQGVPTELYDAAKVDGAGPVYSFFNITIPMISPVIFYNLVLTMIGAFQYFLTAYVLYNGQSGPDNSALFYMMNLYKEAFVYYNMGYASTLAWGMFIVALGVTIGLFASARSWVYYAGGDQ